MALKKEIAAKIKDLLQQNPKGLSISDIVRKIDINRNTAGRYLENLMVSGQVEMRHFGMAKIYRLAQRVPLSAMLSISSELIMLLDNSLRIIYANEPMLTFLETTQKDIYGKNIEFTSCITLFNDSYNRLIKAIKNGLKGVEWKEEITSEKKGIVFSCHIAPTVFEEGQRGVSILFEDITEHKRANEKIKESEQRFRTLFEGAAEGILVADTETEKFLYANSAICKMLGYSVRELIKMGLKDIHPKSDLEYVRGEFKALPNSEKNVAVNIPCLKKDRTILYVNIVTSIVLLDGKNCIVGFFTDVTKQKRAEESLRDSEERYRKLVEISPDPIILHRDEKIIFMNPAALTLIGASNFDEVIGKNILDFIHPDFRDAVKINIQNDLTGEITSTIELSMIRIDGKSVIVEGRGIKTLIDGDYAIQVALRDITERKRAEEALRESEEKYRSILDNTQDAYFRADLEGRVTMANPSAVSIFGFDSVDEMIGIPAMSLYSIPEHRQEILTIIKEQGGIKDFISEGLRKDGTIFWVSMNVQYTYDTLGTVTGTEGFIRDITDRKQAEETLRESEEKYRSLVERANDGICIIQDGIIKFCNRQIIEFWGGSIKEILGRNITDFVHPDGLSKIIDRYNRRMAGESPPSIYETILKRKDGGRFFPEVNAGVVSYDGRPGDLIIVRDINERKRIEEALRDSEATAQALINAPTDSILLLNSKGEILALNETAALRFGRPKDELIGVLADHLLPEEIARERRLIISQLLEGKSVVRFEDKRDGIWFDTVAYPIISKDGEINKIAIVSREITDLKQKEEELRKSKR